ncbi:MAG: hypothetical protein QHC65_04095, partial [Sphingomonas sp.]
MPGMWRRVSPTRWERRGERRGQGRASVWREGGHWHGHAILRGRIVPLVTRRGHNRRFRSAVHAMREVAAAFPCSPAATGPAVDPQ